MEEGFDIKKVKVVDNTSELLTDKYVKGLDPASDIRMNAELEGREFVQFPDGATQEVKGDTHEKGGVKMNLPDGTKVLSDHLTITREDIKRLNKEFDLKASTSSTFANVLKVYTKKIGLDKLYEEQEELFETLQEQLKDKSIDKGTNRVNQEYLSKKIYEAEQQKQPKEQLKSDFFNVLFGMQESQKKPEVDGAKFKYGGVSRPTFDNLCKKYGMTPEQGITMLKNGGILIPKYQDGHEHNEEENPFSGTFRVYATPHEFSKEDVYLREKQSTTTEGGFGKIENKEDLKRVLQNLYENFPDIVSDPSVFGKYATVENGQVKLTSANFDFNKVNKAVSNFQDKANTRMKESANTIIKNPQLFSKEQIEQANNYLTNETFTDEGMKAVRGVDSKLGNFTSGRFSLGLDVVTPEELKDLRSKGIYTLNQLKDADVKLSPESKSRLDKLIEIKGEQADFKLAEYLPNAVTPTPGTTEEEKKTQIEPGKITDKTQLPTKKYPTLFFTPDQSTLPPSAQQAETMATNRFQRIDPLRIGIEDTLRQLSDSRQFVTEQLDTLPPTQRAAALASVLAQTQSAENEAFLKTNVQNAQFQSQAELFNIGQAEKEDVYRSNNLLNYETRALAGAAKTEEDYRNYFDFNRKVALNNYNTQRNLNLMNSLFPDYQLDFTGVQVNYDPSNPNWNVDLSKERRDMLQLVGNQNLIP